jgi:asparagine synthase (glutamine-hydrolysing)
VLWRQKEQFSDGVGYDWIDSLRAFAEDQVSGACATGQLLFVCTHDDTCCAAVSSV